MVNKNEDIYFELVEQVLELHLCNRVSEEIQIDYNYGRTKHDVIVAWSIGLQSPIL